MFTKVLDKIKSIEFPEMSYKSGVLLVGIVGSGYLVYNYGQTTINNVYNLGSTYFNKSNENNTKKEENESSEC